VSTAPISPAAGFMAEHAHYDDDAGFWEAHVDRLGGPACDLGAAAGRVTVRLAERGHEVWAVDIDAEMLDVLAGRARAHGVAHLVHPVQQSMTDPLPVRDAGAVLIPMNTLQVLRARPDQVTCMRRAAEALRPGGEMLFDLALPHFDVVADLVGALLDTGHGMDPSTGDLLLHTAMFEALDRPRGEVQLRIMVERIHRDGSRTAVERPHHLHLYEPDEIPALAGDAGLEVVEATGGFRGEPLTGASERQVWRLRRPA
jgi:SAM-dependent methyltransferase